MLPMTDVEAVELVDLANEMGIPQERVAVHLGISSNYWFKVRSGRMPVSGEVRTKIRKLKRKLKAFVAA